ncbi:MAG: hypothetical protein JOY99_13800 [Sphingomonadaceae bacterium]|nr:hypothetical protein [Sphingomonadaceae bacterium]
MDEGSWIDEELAGSRFCDARPGQRFHALMKQLGSAAGATIPLACQDERTRRRPIAFFPMLR